MLLDHIKKYLSEETRIETARQDDSGEIKYPSIVVQANSITRPFQGLGNKKIELSVIYRDNTSNKSALESIDDALNSYPAPEYLDSWDVSPPTDPENASDGETMIYKWDIIVYAKSSCRP